MAKKKDSMGLAEYLVKINENLENAKQNPVLKAIENLEKNRKSILDNISKYDSQTLQEKVNKLKLDFSNPLVQSAIVNTQIGDSIINSTRIKDLVNLQYSLKPEYLATQKAIESLQQTINNPTIQNSILEDSKIPFYESQIGKISETIAKNQNLFESSKGLASLSAKMASDSLKHKLEEQREFSIPEIVKRDYIPIKMPENPMIGQNEEIISVLKNLQEQNNTLIQFEKLDQDIQNSNIALMNQLQASNEIMIQELRAQNQNLETQLSQKEVEIEQNKKDNIFTRKVAIWGIGISIVVGIASSIIPFYISYQEKLENDKDNEKLLESVNNKTNENQNITMLLKEMQLQNEINKKIEENQIKLLMKATEFQNEYFKKKDKK